MKLSGLLHYVSPYSKVQPGAALLFLRLVHPLLVIQEISGFFPPYSHIINTFFFFFLINQLNWQQICSRWSFFMMTQGELFYIQKRIKWDDPQQRASQPASIFQFHLTEKHNWGGKVTETGWCQSHSTACEGRNPL